MKNHELTFLFISVCESFLFVSVRDSLLFVSVCESLLGCVLSRAAIWLWRRDMVCCDITNTTQRFSRRVITQKYKTQLLVPWEGQLLAVQTSHSSANWVCTASFPGLSVSFPGLSASFPGLSITQYLLQYAKQMGRHGISYYVSDVRSTSGLWTVAGASNRNNSSFASTYTWCPNNVQR